MAGIYFHIPYCKQACHYCDFHFSTNQKTRQAMVLAMLRELELRQHFIGEKNINTIYFGGGTPSLLPADEIEKLLDKCHQLFQVNPNAEITLEANPDDLTTTKLEELSNTKINRLSIGIQSFFEEHLKYMNRAHNAAQAISCIENAQAAGFSNISADLIYGFPGLSNAQFLENIYRLTNLGVPHISAYSLTVEPKTALDRFIETGKYAPINETLAAEQFLLLSNTLENEGYEHYEVSNFALPQKRSKHNSAYWSGSQYIGIGPGAHSYNGVQRSWNVSNNHLYIKSIDANNYRPEFENLSIQTRYNEYVLTRFRTRDGLNLNAVKQQFEVDIEKQFASELKDLISKGEIFKEASYLRLTKSGLLWADAIAANFFIVDDDNNL